MIVLIKERSIILVFFHSPFIVQFLFTLYVYIYILWIKNRNLSQSVVLDFYILVVHVLTIPYLTFFFRGKVSLFLYLYIHHTSVYSFSFQLIFLYYKFYIIVIFIFFSPFFLFLLFLILKHFSVFSFFININFHKFSHINVDKVFGFSRESYMARVGELFLFYFQYFYFDNYPTGRF